ncbi:LLM class flavin-dependent oxidoreductase [bacterium]|nr:LLM class flavin-dependent oxidoreductase [bacterium]
MIFDLFHSVSDPVIQGKRLGSKKVFSQLFSQVDLAESLGFDTIWCAESHFSSETQKQTSVATIPEFHGEVGINSDSFQLAQTIFQKTRKIHFGTAIHNIVGGSGGPIASADRVNTLRFLNQEVLTQPRKVRMGIAAGRFPYQNSPFQITPRNADEAAVWPNLKRYVFIEALEIFLRLLSGELWLQSIKDWVIPPEALSTEMRKRFPTGYVIEKRWPFEAMTLVPQTSPSDDLEIVLGSHDPLALEWGYQFWDLSLFNLSFTAPETIEALHQQMETRAQKYQRQWNRSRLPRTVMVFIDSNRKKAYDLANHVLDQYIEAMRGTAQVPEKTVLLQRALVGDPQEILEQIQPQGSRGYHSQDRLMLWFEFNQMDNEVIQSQMKLFFEKVVPQLT